MTTSQNATAPKPVSIEVIPITRLTTSQNATAPKRELPSVTGRASLTTSQNATAPKRILRNIANNFAAEAGESLTEPIKALSNILVVAADAFEKLDTPMQTFITLALGSTAAIGPLLTMFAGMNTAWGAIRKATTKSANDWAKANAGIHKVREAIASSIVPMSTAATRTEDLAKKNKKLFIASRASAAAMSALRAASVGAGLTTSQNATAPKLQA